MTLIVEQALRWATRGLQRCGIGSARLDAEVLLAHCLRRERSALYRDPDYVLTEDERTRFEAFIGRRRADEPIAYLTGTREFWSLPLTVGPGVLIPRPETECLVELALRYVPSILWRRPRCQVLDVGTGSGNIAIAVAASSDAIDVTALDISPAALSVAQLNARACQVTDRVRCIRGNLLTPLHPQRARFDLLLSNPPYIAAEEWSSLPVTVRCYEPRQALDGGTDGLDFYRYLFAEGPQYLCDHGIAIVEVGYRQASEVSHLVRQTQGWELLEVVKDYGGIERVVVAQRRRGESGSAWIISKSRVGSSFTGRSA